MLKAVLFDMDNTLIDFMRMKRTAVAAALDAMVEAGLPLDRKTAEKRLMTLYWKIGIEHPLIFERFLEQETGTVDYRMAARAVCAYRSRKADIARPLPGVEETLKELHRRKKRLGIVSDAPRFNAWMRLVQMGIDGLLDVVVTLDDTGKEKPSQEPFRLALMTLGLRAEEALFVGDRPERDIAGAKAAGMKVAFARYGNPEWSGSSGADWELADIRDILRIVDGRIY